MAKPIKGIPDSPEIDTANNYLISVGQNLPNHSAALEGRAAFVRQSIAVIPTFRTRQEAFRYAAYLVILAENSLPDEDGCELHTFAAVTSAIRNV